MGRDKDNLVTKRPSSTISSTDLNHLCRLCLSTINANEREVVFECHQVPKLSEKILCVFGVSFGFTIYSIFIHDCRRIRVKCFKNILVCFCKLFVFCFLIYSFLMPIINMQAESGGQVFEMVTAI